MHFGDNVTKYNYHMLGNPLSKVDENRDLGVVISNNKNYIKQCVEGRNDANRMLGL